MPVTKSPIRHSLLEDYDSTLSRPRLSQRRQQLQDLDQLAETTTARSKRRAELKLLASSSNSAHFDDNDSSDYDPPSSRAKHLHSLHSSSLQMSSSIASSPAMNDSTEKLDLREASLEMLEDLIAQSAERLANYRLRRQSDQFSGNDPRLPPSSPTTNEHTIVPSSSPSPPSTVANKRTSQHDLSPIPTAASPPKRPLPHSLSSHHILDKQTFSLVSPTSSKSVSSKLWSPQNAGSLPRQRADSHQPSSSTTLRSKGTPTSPLSSTHDTSTPHQGRRLRTLSTLDTVPLATTSFSTLPRTAKPTVASLSKRNSTASQTASALPDTKPKRRSRHVSMMNNPSSTTLSSPSSSTTIHTSHHPNTSPSSASRQQLSKEARASHRFSHSSQKNRLSTQPPPLTKSKSTASLRKRGKVN
ncbi:hypothetical protein DM01DRAFT_1017114 [Hesseltinella vesiculosa]|uniref:Uncharacterized protein n=1 Tax=Hesseltinella vesiculosa TaxID=101127 RepID=A0A1X2GKM1_9FUNG|nr:hypothetical protein DM01DRAFT_1017114 [Hesseltinella vesiculosa]